MALRNVSDIGPNKNLTPNSEVARINYVVANRALYNGNFHELNLDPISSTIPAVSFNWFRKVAQFYPEFMFSQRPEISVEGNERVAEAFADAALQLWPNLQQANLDMIRYGQGLVASHPMDPLQFMTVERDQHYEVVNELGQVTADIIVEETDRATPSNTDVALDLERDLNVYVYWVSGESEWRRYRFGSGTVGPLIGTVEIPQRGEGRQVVPLASNPDLRSPYDDIKQPIAQIARIATATAKTLRRNSSPHLYGPDSMLARDTNGAAEISTEGMFLPVQQGDVPPGYLTWESKVEAQSWSHDVCMNAIFAITGLSPVLFDPGIQTGTLTGVALRRTMLPFVTKLDHYARVNERAIQKLIALWNANRGAAGQEVFAFLDRDIDVEWGYEEVFEETTDTAESNPQGAANSSGNDGGPEGNSA